VSEARPAVDGALQLMRVLRRLKQQMAGERDAYGHEGGYGADGDDPSVTLDRLFHHWSRLRSPELDLKVQDHDPRWAAAFQRERHRLAISLGDDVADIHHVGSTSIPPLPSKNIIDLAVAIRVPRGEVHAEALVALGYQPYGVSPIDPQMSWFWRILPGEQGAFVVHTGDHRNPRFSYMVNFRDFLRALPEERHRYAGLKRELAAVPDQSWLEYSVRKGVLAWQIIHRANAWAAARNSATH
jgi:GrpB-like predicted nucleotidyltransferase (UPF0157 family)